MSGLLKKNLSLPALISYKNMAYFATALTGLCALSAQVIWQKHLAILTGSEARSLSLIVAVFLSGLAGGYYLFGRLTERKNISRSALLKYYGYVELLTGLYIGLFPFYFELLKRLSFNSPNFFIVDISIAVLALLFPTVLMGAGIPMLTAALPEHSRDINKTHAKVYGWNTVGACLGALTSGFYLISTMGLDLSLNMVGLLNVIASMVFIGNRQTGSVLKREEPPSIPSPFPNSFFIFFVFLTGALLISLEVILVRILNLSVGAGVYNFPIILSIFVGGLGYGSLSIKRARVSTSFFVHQLLSALFALQIIFWTAPYWSIWMNHIRISLTSVPPNHPIYHGLVFLFLFVLIFPAVVFMGRLLPLSYMFLKKTERNYGKVCGQLYFFNTLGAVFGAVVLGYLAFYLFNLDIIFKTSLYILFLPTLAVLVKKRNKFDFVLLGSLGLILLILPTQWDRSGHEVGYFRVQRYNPELHLKGLFVLPKNRSQASQVAFFKDGPNSTVSIIQYPSDKRDKNLNVLKDLFSASMESFSSYSVIVNGKSDGNSLGDFSTVFFMLPYLHSADKPDLKSAFVGLGTGLSAGAYTPLEDIQSIDVLEISPFVIKALQTVPPELNFNVMYHKKVRLIEIDAFKHFTRYNSKYDIIVSEPSNPWVVGVENLYTTEFYELVAKNLNRGGVFGQWLHTYDMDMGTLELVVKTINHVFPYAHLYKVGHKDILIVASREKLLPLSEKKFNHPFIKKFYRVMGISRVEDLYLSQVLDEQAFEQTARLSPLYTNSLIFPQIIYRAGKAMFFNTQSDPFNLINKFHPYKKTRTEKIKAFDRQKTKNWANNCLSSGGFTFLCADMETYTQHWKNLKNEKFPYLQSFGSYAFLRKHGLISYDEKLMDRFLNESLKEKNANLDQLSLYIYEKIRQKKYEEADRDALAFKNSGLINEQHYNSFKTDLKNIQEAHNQLDHQLQPN